MRATVEHLSIEGWSIVDVGEYSSVNEAVSATAAQDPVVYVLSNGVHHLDEELHFDERAGVAVVGRPDATLRVTDPEMSRALTFVGTERAIVKNVTFDFSESGVGPRAIGATVPDGLLVEDVSVTGQIDRLERPPASLMWFNITTPEGTGVVRNLRMADGCIYEPGTQQQHNYRIGVNVEAEHEGTLRLEDCEVSGFIDNGVYAKTSGPGRTIIEGGHFENNGNGNIRLGTGEHGDDVVRDATVVLDGEHVDHTGCGIWAQEGRPRIEGCTITATSWENDLLRVSEGAVVRDTVIESDASSRAIKISGKRENKVLMDNVVVRDSGSGDARQYSVQVADGGAGVTFRSCTFRFDHGAYADRHGIHVGTPGVVFDDCEFRQTGDANVLLLLGAERTDVRFSRFRGGTLGVNSDSAASVFVGNQYDDVSTNLDGFDFDNMFDPVE
ncbi:right-handed parallel beta-helix repeat-containing protein [Haloprofundus salilacus]|uniref:right-handed parallel beta-helix repeat-containing protein n=1 Tax=Haloprofundus salilacus TaxID=2876190 RepID=UPI001CC9F5BD|nr:right-handed parallel beta-helix repeat-containing protein [Haloprofundus salilacus]